MAVTRRSQTVAKASAVSVNAQAAPVKKLINGVDRAPSEKPAFTVGDLRKAIPAHCFRKDLVKSFGYLFADLAIVGVLFYLSTFINLVTDEAYGAKLAPFLRHVLWSAYWVAQGSVFTGLWVIGHEAGHGGFAETTRMNDAVGFIVHSALLVPFFSWKISHRRHHSNTGNLARDEVFVPAHNFEPKAVEDISENAHEDEEHTFTHMAQSVSRTISTAFHIVIMLTLGWPLYLLTNATGREYPKGAWVNHFLPSSPIFTSDREQRQVIYSDLGLVAAFGALGFLAKKFSVSAVMYYYFIPYLVCNLFLVLITFLQHTDFVLPHYSADEWDWLRGALATIDRDFGLLNIVFHHITDTHVAHHLFSSMPHYHAQEATEAIKPILKDYYRFDNTPIAKALWNSFSGCTEVRPDAGGNPGIMWFTPPTAQKSL